MLLQVEEHEIEPGTVHLALKGRLALGRESQRVETLSTELVARGVGKLILDLAGVDHIDSAGVGVVTMCAGTMKQAGGQMVVVAPAGRVRDLLKMTGVDTIVSVVASLDAAKAAVA